MSYFIWLLAVGLAGWASGEIVGGEGFGRVADILLGHLRCIFGSFHHGAGKSFLGICQPAFTLDLGSGRTASNG